MASVRLVARGSLPVARFRPASNLGRIAMAHARMMSVTPQAAAGPQQGGAGAASVPTSSVRPNRDSYIGNADRDYKRKIDEMIRVDHAGETAAVKIYEGQLWALRGTPAAETIAVRWHVDNFAAPTSPAPKFCVILQKMKDGELEHLKTVEDLMKRRRARPTLMLPLANIASFVIGAGSAMLGKQAAMACTEAVETVVGRHYNEQIRELLERGYDEKQLAEAFKKMRDDEMEHLDTAVAHDAQRAPLYNVLSTAVKAWCTAAIWIAKRV